MPRISIDVTTDQLSRLTDEATRAGLSLTDYVASKALDESPMRELRDLLAPRIAEADSGARSERSIMEIAAAARAKRTG